MDRITFAAILTALLVAGLLPSTGADPIYVNGTQIVIAPVTTTAAPENLTFTAQENGYLLAWEAPAFTPPDMALEGYTLWRVPGNWALDLVKTFDVDDPAALSHLDETDAGHYVYFLVADYVDVEDPDFHVHSLPSNFVLTIPESPDYPYCAVIKTYWHEPYVSVHPDCAWPPPL